MTPNTAGKADPLTSTPTPFSEEVFETILARISAGEGVVTICKDDDMPSTASFYRWIGDDEKLRDRYVRAREEQADLLADEIISIADDGSRDYGLGEGGIAVVNHDHIARSRLRVDARKWKASKLAPKKYGDKVEHALTGEGGGPIKTITRIELVAVAAKPKPDDNPPDPAS